MPTPSRDPRRATLVRTAAVAAVLVGSTLVSPVGQAAGRGVGQTAARPASAAVARPSRRVLLLSVDGMHQSDLSWFVRHHPHSALAALVHRGTEFTRARTPFPSDSFPGLVGQVTGGHPRTTGIYYDVTYNHALLDPTASTSAVPDRATCASSPRGANVPFDESLDRDGSRLDAGQGLADLPRDVLRMTGDPRRLLDPVTLPIDPRTCRRVYPHSYLRVNTLFEVARQHGLRTAWSDKHPAYEILQGPSGRGVQDLFTPEINSVADAAGHDWTQVSSLTRRYDRFKVRAVLHEIHGLDHSGRRRVGTPGVFGMNFQSVSTAEKLPISDGHLGGYVHAGRTPGRVLRASLAFVDRQVAAMVSALRRTHQLDSTTLVLSSKHGQSPQDRASLRRIDDGAVLDALNAAWASAHPRRPQPLVAASLNDDGMLLWFSDGDRTPLAARFASRFLRAYDGSGTGTDGHARATDVHADPVAYRSAGLARVHAGRAAARFVGAAHQDPRVPDLIGETRSGVVYTGKTAKIAEHGGNHAEDRHVPLVVAGPGVRHAVRATRVQTTRIAPTILTLLGLDPRDLQAVRAEHTPVLPLG